jgi:arsenite methyltransferase
MTEQFHFDDAASRELSASYTSPIVAERRRKARALLDLHPGDAVLDIGTGPGFLAAEIAAEVGPSGRVEGIDRSQDMLALARRRCHGLPQVALHEADALQLPFPSASFEAAAIVQVYEFIPQIAAALGELHRVLRPGGRAVIVDTEWASLVWETGDRARTERVLHAWDEHLADPHLPRRLAPLLRDSGFEVEAVEPYTAFSRTPEPFGNALAKLVAGFVPGRRGVTQEDAAAWLADLAATSSNGSYFFSLTAFFFLARRPAEA